MPDAAPPVILLVEDHAALRNLLCERLRMEGFEVIAAANLREARKLLAEAGANYAVTLADYTLPDGKGLELHEALSGRAFLLISAALFEEGPPPGVNFLAKPFLIPDLIEHLHAAIDSVHGASGDTFLATQA